MPRETWYNTEQETFLSNETRLEEYKAAQAVRCYINFWPKLFEDWEKAYPRHEELFPGQDPAKLTDDEKAQLRKAIQQRRTQLQAWYRWRFQPRARAAMQSLTKLEKDLFSPRTRTHQKVEVYSKLYYNDKIKPVVHAKIEEQGLTSRADKLRLIRETTREMLENEEPDILEQVDSAFQELRTKQEGPESEVLPAPRTPERAARSIREIPAVLDRVLSALAKQTGWTYTVLMGGPNPASNGELTVASFHIGETETGLSFGQTHPQFESMCMKPYSNFVHRVNSGVKRAGILGDKSPAGGDGEGNPDMGASFSRLISFDDSNHVTSSPAPNLLSTALAPAVISAPVTTASALSPSFAPVVSPPETILAPIPTNSLAPTTDPLAPPIAAIASSHPGPLAPASVIPAPASTDPFAPATAVLAPTTDPLAPPIAATASPHCDPLAPAPVIPAPATAVLASTTNPLAPPTAIVTSSCTDPLAPASTNPPAPVTVISAPVSTNPLAPAASGSFAPPLTYSLAPLLDNSFSPSNVLTPNSLAPQTTGSDAPLPAKVHSQQKFDFGPYNFDLPDVTGPSFGTAWPALPGFGGEFDQSLTPNVPDGLGLDLLSDVDFLFPPNPTFDIGAYAPSPSDGAAGIGSDDTSLLRLDAFPVPPAPPALPPVIPADPRPLTTSRHSGRMILPSKRAQKMNEIGQAHSNDNSSSNKENVPPGSLLEPPQWLLAAETYFVSNKFGDDWTECIKAWRAFEVHLGYTQKKPMPRLDLRPEEWTTWITKGRGGIRAYDQLPAIDSTLEFGIAVMKWWNAIQPAFRQSTDSPMPVAIYNNPDDPSCWESLRRGGPNGMVSVLTLLAWWGLSREKTSQWEEDSETRWLACVVDVRRVFERLTSGRKRRGSDVVNGATTKKSKT